MPIRYRALSFDDYRIVDLDTLSALFDLRSGQTHLVASPVPEILALMEGGDWSVPGLLVALAEQFDLPPGEDHSAGLTARLEELKTLGLVEKLPSQPEADW